MSSRDRSDRKAPRPIRSDDADWSKWDPADSAPGEPTAGTRGAIDEDLPAWSPTSDDSLSSSEYRFEKRIGSRYRTTSDYSGDREERSRFPELTRSLRGKSNRSASSSSARQTSLPRENEFPWEQTNDEFSGTTDVVDDYSARRSTTRSRSGGQTRRRPVATRNPRVARTMPALAVPGFVVRSGIAQERLLLGLSGVAVVSLALMVAIIANRIPTLPETISLHLNAAGVPDLSGSRSNLWRLPLGVTMLTIMNAVGAWFFLTRDAFVPRLLLGTTILVHFLAWMAVFLLCW